MGAGVALNVGVRYPERVAGLVISRPAWVDRPMPHQTIALFALIAMLLRQLEYSVETDEGLDWAWRRLQRDEAFADVSARFPDTAWSLRAQLSAAQAVKSVARLERLPLDQPIVDLSDAANIRVPTLVLAHHRDPIHPFTYGQRLANAIPSAHLVEVTARSVDRKRHVAQVQQHLTAFVDQYRTARAAA
jgi:pimeloyl-ACP methyl ester carboxylesterase